MSEPEPIKQQDAKGEKQEKDREKQEKARGEKNWDEKWRRDPLNAAVWAFILIWLGLTLLADNLGLLKNIPYFQEWWRLFFLGAGGILLLEALFRLLMPAFRTPIVGTLILGIVFLAIGIGDMIAELWQYLLPLLAILFGLLILLRGLFRKRE